ncbi:hypothetical protein V3N99_07280 [Dermatophilaceae bacterium Soc4.6]
MAAVGVGLVPPETDWAQAGTTVTPDADHREVYGELYGLYTSLYGASRPQVHALARLQGD